MLLPPVFRVLLKHRSPWFYVPRATESLAGNIRYLGDRGSGFGIPLRLVLWRSLLTARCGGTRREEEEEEEEEEEREEGEPGDGRASPD